MSAAAAIAEFPNKLEKIFLNTDNALNKQGIYALNFFMLGVPHTVIIDDYLPLKKATGKTLFAHPSKSGAIWMAILEKAFAKYHGNYAHIVGGAPQLAIRTLVGGPYKEYYHSKANSLSADALWDAIHKHDMGNDILSASTHGGSDSEKDDKGLV